jgi:hypothetical protein
VDDDYCSQAIADGGPGELAIIIDELNLIEFVDLNGNQQYTMEYNAVTITLHRCRLEQKIIHSSSIVYRNLSSAVTSG